VVSVTLSGWPSMVVMVATSAGVCWSVWCRSWLRWMLRSASMTSSQSPGCCAGGLAGTGRCACEAHWPTGGGPRRWWLMPAASAVSMMASHCSALLRAPARVVLVCPVECHDPVDAMLGEVGDEGREMLGLLVIPGESSTSTAAGRCNVPV
jgi:hypothetical protein